MEAHSKLKSEFGSCGHIGEMKALAKLFESENLQCVRTYRLQVTFLEDKPQRSISRSGP